MENGRVSGDFYDVHQALGGDHVFVVLGDVAGKGVHAAVVTSMARYTVRTLSAQGWSPGRALEQLNQALLADIEEERFCTVLYGRVGQDEADVTLDWTPGVTVTLALGGHPQPLVRWLDGSVTAVGQPGTALGLLNRVEIKEETVHLQPGEVLLAFMDGVTEARTGAEQFGEHRLADVLAAAAVGLRGSSWPPRRCPVGGRRRRPGAGRGAGVLVGARRRGGARPRGGVTTSVVMSGSPTPLYARLHDRGRRNG